MNYLIIAILCFGNTTESRPADAGAKTPANPEDIALAEKWRASWSQITTPTGENATGEIYDFEFFSVTARRNRSEFLAARKSEAVDEAPVEVEVSDVRPRQVGRDRAVVLTAVVRGGRTQTTRTIVLFARDGRIVAEERFDSDAAADTFLKRSSLDPRLHWSALRRVVVAPITSGASSLDFAPGRTHAVAVEDEGAITTRYFVEGVASVRSPWVCVKRTPLFSLKQRSVRPMVHVGGAESMLCGAALGDGETAFFDTNVSPEPIRGENGAKPTEQADVSAEWKEAFDEIIGLTGVWVRRKRTKADGAYAITVFGRKSEHAKSKGFAVPAALLVGTPRWIDVRGGLATQRLTGCVRDERKSNATRVFRCKADSVSDVVVSWTPSKKRITVGKEVYSPVF